ncbi:MAG: hypothetical protein GF317_08395 [Candidatus Lokiarchaeota archaeon]|nr:hypothetical protein [Candidatus Lokiarchaeota archaeon]MBD3199731.1 hypothetical protein [Candidatus Lokiarchaeota archaeon]
MISGINKLYDAYLSEKLHLNNLITSLFKILESETNKRTISIVFTIFNEIPNIGSEFYSFFENNLISNENEEIRIRCFKFIAYNYSDIGEKSLIWSIRKENSTKLLKMMIKDLNNNNFNFSKSIKKELDKRLKRLSEKFELHKNEILFLLDVVRDLRNVRKFEMNNNSYLNLENQCYLQYENNHIIILLMFLRYDLPKSIINLKNLKYLDLSYNYFHKIPRTLKYLPCLKYLDLSWNELEKFPEFIKNIKNSCLRELNLGFNHIKTIPTWISDLNNLHTLDMRSNNLKTLPKFVMDLPNLEFINISDNYLNEIPLFIKGHQSVISKERGKVMKISRCSRGLKSLQIIF